MTSASDPNQLPEQFQAVIDWLDDAPLLAGRQYLLLAGQRQTTATVTRIKFLIDGNSGEHLAASVLQRGQQGVCNLALTVATTPDEPQVNSPDTGFSLLDLQTGQLLAKGTVQHGLHRADNLHWQAMEIDKQARARAMDQKPCVFWLTGLSASGKSTIANQVEKLLYAQGRHTYVLDGDNVRLGLNRDLGFTAADRVENIRRVAETARLMVDAGLIVITSFISQFRAERQMARSLFEPGEFVEVFVDTPLEECERRDPKGLYRKARQGGLRNFTGYDSPYEKPLNPELRIETRRLSPQEAARQIVDYMAAQ